MSDVNKKLTGPFDVALGRAIRARRDAVGLTQPKLATAVGISFQQLQKYEKGANRLSIARLVAIATALDAPAMDFVDSALAAVARASDEAPAAEAA